MVSGGFYSKENDRNCTKKLCFIFFSGFQIMLKSSLLVYSEAQIFIAPCTCVCIFLYSQHSDERVLNAGTTVQ